jgi:hypothetical protein
MDSEIATIAEDNQVVFVVITFIAHTTGNVIVVIFFLGNNIFTFQLTAKDLVGFADGILVPKNLTKFSLKSNENQIS